MCSKMAFGLLAMWLSVSAAAASNYHGTVTCTKTGRALKNVYVRIVENNTSCFTDVEGRFSVIAGNQSEETLVFDKPGFVVLEKRTAGVDTQLDIRLSPRKISAASYRMRKYIENQSAYNTLMYSEAAGWKMSFEETELGGDFKPDPELVRRDPSAVIKVNDLYYVYYTRGKRYSDGPVEKIYPWDQCDIWYATSADGLDWHEKGPAVVRGANGRFDDRSVFTPEVLAHDGKYYLVYQAVKTPYNEQTLNVVAMAVAENPAGPWHKLADPVLFPTHNGIWDTSDTSKRVALKQGDFDSQKVHDPCILHYHGKFYLYYKGQRVGENRFYGNREIMWGVAIAEQPEGPYIKSDYNPITNTGHEVCVWKYRGGVASIHTIDGPEENTIQWSPDGINFEIMATVDGTPTALGVYRTEHHDKDPATGIRWGLCTGHGTGTGHWQSNWNYIKRFDVVELQDDFD